MLPDDALIPPFLNTFEPHPKFTNIVGSNGDQLGLAKVDLEAGSKMNSRKALPTIGS